MVITVGILILLAFCLFIYGLNEYQQLKLQQKQIKSLYMDLIFDMIHMRFQHDPKATSDEYLKAIYELVNTTHDLDAIFTTDELNDLALALHKKHNNQ
jgi:non-homologous end joining protein Ku